MSGPCSRDPSPPTFYSVLRPFPQWPHTSASDLWTLMRDCAAYTPRAPLAWCLCLAWDLALCADPTAQGRSSSYTRRPFPPAPGCCGPA